MEPTNTELSMPSRAVHDARVLQCWIHGLKRALSLAMTATLAAATTGAAAQPASKAAAEALFDRGMLERTQGHYAQAATYFQQSLALAPGIGVRLYLADCYEQMGRPASAWALFREAGSEAKEQGEIERANKAASRAARLKPKLSFLVLHIDAGNNMPGLAVSVDEVAMPQSAWNIPLPVDPGQHAVAAHAPGYHTYTTQLTVSPGASQPVSVAVPALKVEPPLAARQPPALAPKTAPAVAVRLSPATLRDEPMPQPWVRSTALVTGGLGVVALGFGTYFGLHAMARNADAKRLCPDAANCFDKTAVAASEQANTAAQLANGLLLGGALLAGTGVVLWLITPSKHSTELALHAQPQGINLTGAF